MADSLLGNFTTKIFHAQSDPRTNQWAADLIGKSLQTRHNSGGNINTGWNRGLGYGENWSSNRSSAENHYTSNSSSGDSRNTSRGSSGGQGESWGSSEQMDYTIQPSYFTTLRKSGGVVDALLFQGGRTFRHSRATWLPVSFKQ